VKRYSWNEQQELFQQYKWKAYWSALAFFILHPLQIMEEAKSRYDEGFVTFGTRMFHMSKGRLHHERLEEAADLIDWTIAELERRDRESKD